jgi:hypothetical protein
MDGWMDGWMDGLGGNQSSRELMNGSCLYKHTTTTSWLVSASIIMARVYLSHIPHPLSALGPAESMQEGEIDRFAACSFCRPAFMTSWRQREAHIVSDT